MPDVPNFAAWVQRLPFSLFIFFHQPNYLLLTAPDNPSFKKRIKVAVRNTYRLYGKVFVLAILKVQRRIFRRRDGINLVGYFSSTFGVAEVGRFFARQAVEVGLPFSITNIYSETHQVLTAKELSFYQPFFNRWAPFYKTVFFINAAELVKYHERKTELFAGRYNAAVFFWEFDDYFYFPEAFAVLNEAIAFTDFVATAIRKAAPANFKVTKLRFPFVQNWEITMPPAAVRNKYAIAANDFVFFFNFDFRSIYERKNPAAILQALDLAFNEQDAVTLVMKTIHAEQKGKSFDTFQAVLNGMKLKSKVLLINEGLERNDMMSLINAADCYISLHRSEGLGLGLMEAMSMGKPAIATAFGGNLDFMNADNSLLVDYKLVPLEQDNPPYKKGWLWAEADVQMAATHMRKLYLDRPFAKTVGQKAQAYITANYNSHAFSKELQAWLHEK